MKTRIKILGLVVLVAGVAAAAARYSGNLVNNPALAYNSTYVVDMNTVTRGGITSLAAQAIYSSATIPSATFTDGSASTAAITVASLGNLSSASATDQITIGSNAVIQSSAASNTITVVTPSGLTGAILTINGTLIPNNAWRVNVASNTAADIATQINTYVRQVTANAHGTATVSLVARNKGVIGNSYTLASSTPSALSVGGATFSGGRDPAFQNQYITVNGTTYYRGYSWNVPSSRPETSTATAISIASLLNHISGIQAHAAGSVVYATATVAGALGNSFTIVSSTPTAMTVASPTFTGGVSNAVITIAGTPLTQGTQWTKGASTTLTARSIASAINTAFAGVITSTNVANVVYATSTIKGASQNFAITSSIPASLALSGPTFFGGTTPAYALNTKNITIPATTLTTGLPVLYTGSPTISPLVSGSTYYTAKIDANTVALATTSAFAVAGQYVTLISSTSSGLNTFTLAPLAYTGTAGFFWEASNDGTNYNPIGVSSVTYSSPSSLPSSTSWDFGQIGLRYVRLNVTAPTTGGLNLVVAIQGD